MLTTKDQVVTVLCPNPLMRRDIFRRRFPSTNFHSFFHTRNAAVMTGHDLAEMYVYLTIKVTGIQT